MSQPKFFALIIGTEILNRRRTDKHFDFITQELLKRNHKLTGSFIIEDDPGLIVQTIKFIASQSNSIIFSFGGIGSTPDDYTRQCAATALSDGKLYLHQKAKEIISGNVDTNTHPHALNMAMLPKNSGLLKNYINNMPAFSLDDRYFFMPGFPEMSHPMITDIMDSLFKNGEKTYQKTLTALCKESHLIDIMQSLPDDIQLSSLPKRYADGYRTTIHLESNNEKSLAECFKLFTDKLDLDAIHYSMTEE